jgi:hypothetical protein
MLLAGSLSTHNNAPLTNFNASKSMTAQQSSGSNHSTTINTTSLPAEQKECAAEGISNYPVGPVNNNALGPAKQVHKHRMHVTIADYRNPLLTMLSNNRALPQQCSCLEQ